LLLEGQRLSGETAQIDAAIYASDPMLGVDAANLGKVIEGKRKPSKALLVEIAAQSSQKE
jgi:hypothetical protein